MITRTENSYNKDTNSNLGLLNIWTNNSQWTRTTFPSPLLERVKWIDE